MCYGTVNASNGTNLKYAMKQLHTEVQHIPHTTEDPSGIGCYIN
jgi:hypothetical protein